MMNLLFIFVLFLLNLVSCNGKRSNETQPLTTKTDSVNLNDKGTEFLSIFKSINPKGLHVYPPSWDNIGNLNKTPFEGTPINADNFSFVDNEEIFLNIQAYKDGNSHMFAIGKFVIDNNYWGLIVRQYSQYDESLVQLLLWKKNENRIFKGIDLADSFGDEGWFFDIESWFQEYKSDSILKIITRKKESEFDEDFKNRTYTDSLKTNIFRNGKFVESHNKLIDTMNFKLKEWK